MNVFSLFIQAEVACSFLEPELQVESQAGRDQSAVGAQQWCDSAGIDQQGVGVREKKKRKSKSAVQRAAAQDDQWQGWQGTVGQGEPCSQCAWEGNMCCGCMTRQLFVDGWR